MPHNRLRVFLYGTLLPGQSNHSVVREHVEEAELGAVMGRLLDSGSYPAVLLDGSKSLIKGQWVTVSRRGLEAIDELEEFYGIEENNDYARVWVKDAVRPNVQGWIYVWESDRGCPTIRSGYWPDYLKRRTT